jgi:hypothetical protein
VTRAAREGVALERCPLVAVVAPHRRGEVRLSDELAVSWAGGPTLAERHPRVMAHLREAVRL